MSGEHHSALQKLCRVCGNNVYKVKTPRQYKCYDHQADLRETFGLDIALDSLEPETYPTQFCHTCKNVIYCHKRALINNREYTHKVTVKEWECHVEENCKICNPPSAPTIGRPKKLVKEGRPPLLSVPSLLKHIKDTAPKDIHTEKVKIMKVPFEYLCPLCNQLLTKPIELRCGKYACAMCCCNEIRTSNSFTCPCCHKDHLSDYVDGIKAAPNILLVAIGNLSVTCTVCDQIGKLKDHQEHLQSSCQTHFTPSSDIDTILNKSSDTPLNPVEQKVQSALFSRSMTNSSTATLKIQTGGQPHTLVRISTPRVPSGKASASTLRRRSKELRVHRTHTSGGHSTQQLASEIKLTGKENSRELLDLLFKDGSVVKVTLPEQVSLAMKADLQLTWSKVRALRRWVKQMGVEIASEAKMRKEAKLYTSEDNLKAEYAPFTFPLKDSNTGTIEIHHKPMAYVVNLWAKIEELLNENDNERTGVHRLQWQNGIPNDEIWVKVGGDKGGGSFKMNFQICNVAHPNSVNNTCVFCAFEAPDNPTNLRIALERYRSQIDDLSTKTWRGKKVKVFMSGDYEFLCQIYGLSGASGKHCCLWCLTTKDQLKCPPTTLQLRTTHGICEDHKRFVAAGSQHKRAKYYNNAIREPLFKNVPIDQVCPPGLHMSLGIFYRLFSLLESECHDLDLMVRNEDSSLEGGASYAQHIEALDKMKELKSQLDNERQELTHREEVLELMVAFSDPESSEDPRMAEIFKDVDDKRRDVEHLIKNFKEAEESVAKGFKLHEGPFVKTLQLALNSFNVEKQAYYSGTFVGNHVHRTLQPQNTRELCDSIRVHAQRYSPPVISAAKAIARKFHVAFELFAKCHKVYDKSSVTSEEINTLEIDIKSFVTYYKATFPNSTVFPKLHILEKHTVPWIRKWGVAFGLMGEQGAESIHRWFNEQKRVYGSLSDALQKLHCMMKEHFIHISPTNIAQQPPIKRRKLL